MEFDCNNRNNNDEIKLRSINNRANNQTNIKNNNIDNFGKNKESKNIFPFNNSLAGNNSFESNNDFSRNLFESNGIIPLNSIESLYKSSSTNFNKNQSQSENQETKINNPYINNFNSNNSNQNNEENNIKNSNIININSINSINNNIDINNNMNNNNNNNINANNNMNKNNNNMNINSNNTNNNNNINNNLNNNSNNIIDNFMTDEGNYDISNMIYPTPEELNGNDGKRNSLSFDNNNEVPEMSLMTDEELPSEIHIHPIIKAPLSQEICIICLEKKTCLKGHKCNLCPLKICEQCVYSVVSHYYSNDKHRHSLVLVEKRNYQCDECKKSNGFKNKFCFYCEECDFGICLDCFIPRKKDEEDQIHEHLIINQDNLPLLVCQICGERKNEGYKCNGCQIELCNKCYNNIKSQKKNNNLHAHKVFLSFRDNWTCNICKKKNLGKISFLCKQCNLNFCLNCFLE